MDEHRTGLVVDPTFEDHDTGNGHPERPARLRAIRDAFQSHGLIERCVPIGLREATDDEILAVHEESYLRRLRNHCTQGATHIDAPDSAICPASYALARLAAGTVIEAIDQTMDGRIDNALCAIRPPGHHCERGESMGFCLLSNAAIAAQYLRDAHSVDRVAVIDWDVHHGNGTQHVFEDSADVLVCNIHGHPAYVYPGTGFAEERGRADGLGATVNVPLYPGSGDDDYKAAFDKTILPSIEDFRPQFLIISAGFDAHRDDPLAPLNLDSASFTWMTRAILDAADRHANGRLVSILEGGYDLDALGESASLHLTELLNAGSP